MLGGVVVDKRSMVVRSPVGVVATVLAGMLIWSAVGCALEGIQGTYRPARPWEAEGYGKLTEDSMVGVCVESATFVSWAEDPSPLAFARPGDELSHIFVRICDIDRGARLVVSVPGISEPAFTRCRMGKA